ncbi:MAG: citrate lyase holo-[acyl-carrier protein] synthase [Eubacteriales bacterium]|nr:citrate lyase holo-[acyl-carrier protein] synthase [Eubacteriales bacterium]
MKNNLVKKVNTQDMAVCREMRAGRQIELLQKYGGSLISFTMNIPGEVKQNTLIYKGFKLAKRSILERLNYLKIPILFLQEINEFTGNELYISVYEDAINVKKALCALEEADAFGRLLDIDVLRQDFSKVSRRELDLPERNCIICGLPVSSCAPQRKHCAELLYKKTQDIIYTTLVEDIANGVSVIAQKALLMEALTSPKPGLVDRYNSGAHKDMDLNTFCISANALMPYLKKCAEEGIKCESPQNLMPILRNLGLLAEQQMYKATNGVNTHKGAIYGLGILCAAAGFLLFNEDKFNSDKLFEISSQIAKDEVKSIENLKGETAHTGGVEQYKKLGLLGARGEAKEGFPSVGNIALPTLKARLKKGESFNSAGVYTLIALMANVFDSNVIRRVGIKRQEELKKEAQSLIEKGFNMQDIIAFDNRLIEENISPGGCADLLSFTYFVYMLESETL